DCGGKLLLQFFEVVTFRRNIDPIAPTKCATALYRLNILIERAAASLTTDDNCSTALLHEGGECFRRTRRNLVHKNYNVAIIDTLRWMCVISFYVSLSGSEPTLISRG